MIFTFLRRVIALLLLCAGSTLAQDRSSKTIPDTPAGHTLQAWLDAFNSGDRTKLEAYVKALDPTQSVDGMMMFRSGTGGFDLLSIESSEPLHIRFRLKEKASPTSAVGICSCRLVSRQSSINALTITLTAAESAIAIPTHDSTPYHVPTRPRPSHCIKIQTDAMPNAAPKALFCPTCRKLVLASSEDFPFCSDRCRLLDLGKWASGDYKISSPILDPDLLEDLEHAQQQRSPVHEEKSDWKH